METYTRPQTNLSIGMDNVKVTMAGEVFASENRNMHFLP